MGKADAAVKIWLNDNERFADLFNGAMFHGEQIILPDELEDLDRETDILVTDKQGKRRGMQRHRDLVKRWRRKIDLAVLACESQDRIHYAMPVRGMFQDGLFYTDQIRSLWRQHQRKETNNGQPETGEHSFVPAKHLTPEEYLSRFRKTDKIYPILNLIFYYDLKEWDGAVELYDMFRLSPELREEKLLRQYIPNYRINLVDAGNVEFPERFHSDLQQIFGMLKYRNEKEKLQSYMLKNREYFENVDVDTYQAMREFLRSERQLKSIRNSKGKEERIDMCKALEDLYHDGLEKGKKEGIKEGERSGMKALVETCRDLGVPKETAVSQLIVRFAMEKEDAWESVNRYW